MDLKHELICWAKMLDELMVDRDPIEKTESSYHLKRIQAFDANQQEEMLYFALSLTLYQGTLARVPDIEQLRKRLDPFETACKRPRFDSLGFILNKIIGKYIRQQNKRPPLKIVISELEDINGCIQEIDWDAQTVSWLNHTGKERDTSFKSIDNRITQISKKYLQKNIPPSR